MGRVRPADRPVLGTSSGLDLARVSWPIGPRSRSDSGQLLAKPFSVIKLDFGTIHRGISNTGDFERVMFWISMNRRSDFLPVEPVVEVIH